MAPATAIPARAPRRAAQPSRAPRRGSAPPAPLRRGIRIVPRGSAATRPAALGAGLLDRLLRGRGWIVCIGLLLVGVVFFNVSLLEVNRGITRTSDRAAVLKRENAQLRIRLAELSSSERIQAAAAERGFVLPAPGQVRYLRSDPSVDARRAARRITAPAAVTPDPAAVTSDPTAVTPDPAAITPGAAPVTPDAQTPEPTPAPAPAHTHPQPAPAHTHAGPQPAPASAGTE